MKHFFITLGIMVSLPLFAQDMGNPVVDNDPKLTVAESLLLNDYLNAAQRNGIDFKDKKAIFVTGNSGKEISEKSAYFKLIRAAQQSGHQIATSAVLLTPTERAASGGYDVIVTYWVKIFTNKTKRKILKLAKARG
ncbi:hypothetical protein [Flavobacterium sp.]|uniref:hypothetical protein n=1 Tax=Flavobacterium sp. TaxID=239 RepID=UPI002632DFA7|nr:hypothetical protein [Flavobacterium sp.]